jgi:hypothetical protein
VGTIVLPTDPASTFTATVAGKYILQLTATNAVGTAISAVTISVSTSIGSAVRNQCVNCHTGAGVGAGVYNNWSSSVHAANKVVCYNCHSGADTGAHPGSTANVCATCHYAGGDGGVPVTHDYVANPCSVCHIFAHSLALKAVAGSVAARHTAMSSASAYKVQYKLTGSTVNCATCHNPSNETILQSAARKAWAESGHGETTALPWIPGSSHLWRSSGNANNYAVAASGTDCVRCHTPEGFAQFVGGATPFTNVNPVASAAAAVVSSPLSCNACHANPLNATSDRLVVPQVTTYYNISSAGVQKTHLAANFPDVGESNMCIPCHAGRVSGSALADASAKGFNFTTNGFQNSHYMAAAGLMYVKVGFTAYTTATTNSGDGKGAAASYGQTMTSEADNTVNTAGATVIGKLTSTHRKLGTIGIRNDSHNPLFFGTVALPVTGNLDTNGPCVTCHLQGYTNAGTKRPDAGHSLAVKSAAWDQVCTNCHAAEVGYATDGTPLLVEEQKIPFDTAMSILKNLVQTKLPCEYDSSVYPYFFKVGFAHTAANAFKAFGNVKKEGAAFNLNLLSREPYAYVHARTYTRRLIYDSIDYLDDGLMNQSVQTYVESLTTYGNRPTDASGISANDEVWKYLNAYNRVSPFGWYSPLQRP